MFCCSIEEIANNLDDETYDRIKKRTASVIRALVCHKAEQDLTYHLID